MTRPRQETTIDGALLAILKIASHAHWKPGATLEEEVLRFERVITNSPKMGTFHGSEAVASDVEYLAELLELYGPEYVPEGPMVYIRQTSPKFPTPREFLLILASLLRTASVEANPKYSSLPMNFWEVELMYPDLFQFHGNLESGEYDSSEEAIVARINGEHSAWCREELAVVVGQVHDALMRFPTEKALQANVGANLPEITRSVLQELDRLAHAHVAEWHAEES